jgi:hypothetical protein
MVIEGAGAVPSLLFDFITAAGEELPTAALVCAVDELLPLTDIVRGAIKEAIRESRKQP